jgi:predicted kinase
MARVIITVGIPGSGKTTMVKKFADKMGISATYISADAIREELTGDAGNQTANKRVWTLVYKRFTEALLNDDDIILDNTSIKLKDRQKIYKTIRECNKMKETEIIIFYCPCSVAKSMLNQQNRDRKVPIDVVRRMQLELCEPRLEEVGDCYKVLLITNDTLTEKL